MDFTQVGSFGGIDADADELLRTCFQDHPAYESARDHSKFLIVGRKGSGKTAIFKRLITEHEPTIFSYGHTFDDYPWHHHDLQAEVGVPEERRYLHSWKYLILLGLAKLLLNADSSQPWSDEALEPLASLEQFVVDSYGSRDPDLTQLFSPEKELRFKAGFKLPFLDVEGERLRIRDLPVHLQEVNKKMTEHVYQSLNPDLDYFVCFDQLDLGFSADDPVYAQRLIGLILAARELSRTARDYERRMSAVVFLRDDIYQLLQFEDKNKITENDLSRIEWDQSGSDLTLRGLMERRFQEVFGNSGGVSWDDVFDETKEMPSRQKKYVHMRDRTFLRPRDMIKFCNEVLKAHDKSQPRFDNQSVIGARDEYSAYLLDELDDEIHKHVPAYREYLEVIKAIGSLQFTATQFRDAWNQRKSLAESGVDSGTGLRQLFEFSVVGYLKLGGGGGGSQYVWRYLDPRARFSEEAETFRVHPGFKEALDLIKGTAARN